MVVVIVLSVAVLIGCLLAIRDFRLSKREDLEPNPLFKRRLDEGDDLE